MEPRSLNFFLRKLPPPTETKQHDLYQEHYQAACDYIDRNFVSKEFLNHIQTLTHYVNLLQAPPTITDSSRNELQQQRLRVYETLPSLYQLSPTSVHHTAVFAIANFIILLEFTHNSPMDKLYTYGLRNRPAGYGTVPDGRLLELDTDPELPKHYGTVTYPFPLSPENIYRYELIPIYPPPTLPLYQPGTPLRDLRNKARTAIVEYFDGDYWINDTPVRSLQEWLFYEPIPSEPTQPS